MKYFLFPATKMPECSAFLCHFWSKGRVPGLFVTGSSTFFLLPPQNHLGSPSILRMKSRDAYFIFGYLDSRFYASVNLI